MDGEEHKVGQKKRSKPVEIQLGSDDDEPIGSLLKLKKRKPKKMKLEEVGEKGMKDGVVREELGGMEDTLASFRKKLKGPKKDGGFESLVMPESKLAEELDERRNDEGLTAKIANDVEDKVGVVSLDVNIREKSEKKSVGKVRRSKSALAAKGGRDLGDVFDAGMADVSSSGNHSQMLEGLSCFVSKSKTVAKRAKSASAGNDCRVSSKIHDGVEPDKRTLGNPLVGKEDPCGTPDEILADSLSSFLRKTQSGIFKKPRGASNLKQRKGVQFSKSDLCQTSGGDSVELQLAPKSDSLSDAKLCHNSLNSEDHMSGSCSLAPQNNVSGHQCLDASLGGGSTSMPVTDLKDTDCMIIDSRMRPDDQICGDYSESVLDHSFSALQVQASDSSLAACSEKMGNLKVCGESESIQVQPLMDSSDKPGVEARRNSSDSQDIVFPNGVREFASSNACSTLDGAPTSVVLDDLSRTKLEGALTCGEDSVQHGNSAIAAEDQGNDPLPTDVNEAAQRDASPSLAPSENGADLEDAACISERSIHFNERVVRRVKKRKDGDMAYEGDADWEVVMHESKDRFSCSNLDLELENGGAAAVTAGLKARGVSPVEKIKFKEVLKRKSGLQEYLYCRNKILSLWSKDVTRVLPLTDCGITVTPSDDETSRASLMRDVYLFLDQSGYINTGIAANKEKAESNSGGNYKLLGEKKFEGSSGVSVADSVDGVSFILGQVKSPGTLAKVKDEVAVADESQPKEAVAGESQPKEAVADESQPKEAAADESEPKEAVADESQSKEAVESVIDTVVGPSPDKHLDQGPSVDDIDNQPVDVKSPEKYAESDCSADPLGRSLDNGAGPGHSVMHGHLEDNTSVQCNLGSEKRIIVVGAGPAGLTAARHLQRQGFSVTVLEARSRIGGRVHTDRSSLSVPVDLGASIITGVEADVATERRPDPSSLICAQLGLELTVLNSDCPLYDIVTGQKVPSDVDEALEAEFNSLLDDMMVVVAQKGEGAAKMSLEDGLEYGLQVRRKVLCRDNGKPELLQSVVDIRSNVNDAEGCHVADQKDVKDGALSPLERRVMDWHFAHLEYGCAALLKEVSLPHWNQDDVYGGFGGAHCMIKGGYGAVVESIARGLSIHLSQVVADISYGVIDSVKTDCSYKVKVSTCSGAEFFGDAVLITVPLGCLKAEAIKFSPSLPEWKHSAIQRLGFGVLNKVVLEFPEVFWDDTVDYFGATAEHSNMRGLCFMFWNVKKTVGAPVLIALVVGKAAVDGQDACPSDHVSHALTVLRKLFGDATVPNPVASVVTDWGRDPFSYGAYSYVAVGASGEDYDIIGRPVENCLFFAGEATCKEHPDTVGGAMMSGLREAVRIIDILTTGHDYTSEAEAVDVEERQSTSHRSEVKDIARRLDALDISSVHYARESLLQDMFFTAKTTAGRLRLAKELLSVPVESLKSFAGTKDGLSVLNSWILDSLGKDGTQLLRHCVRLLVLVSTDLVAVRLSCIGKTVKEKVCVHTSRDIRGIASQLVNMWIEVFRKEKATNGGLKLLRHISNVESARSKGKEPGSRKPPIRVQLNATGSKGNLNSKKPTGKLLKPDAYSSKARTDSKMEETDNVPLSEEEQAAIAAAEAARAAARAAMEAYASSEARYSGMQLPKIPSFQKFARREQYAQMDDPERKRWSGGVLGRQDCISEIDSRNCRVRDWSVDFSATCANLDDSRIPADNLSQRSHSNDMACQVNWREHSGESAAGDSTAFTKAWVESSGSDGLKDYHAIERWQCQAAAAEYEFQSSMHIEDEEDSSTMSRLVSRKQEGLVNESSISQVTINNELTVNQRKGSEHIKQGVVDYVASLLMPLYKARKIDKDGYKSIMKKSATKVMEQTTDAEKAMAVSEFLDFKRKNKIRAFVDKLIDRHMSGKSAPKPG